MSGTTIRIILFCIAILGYGAVGLVLASMSSPSIATTIGVR